MTDVALDAGAQFVDKVASSDLVFGQSLCKPLDPLLEARLIINLGNTVKPKKPKCTFNKMIKNLENTELLAGSGMSLGKIINSMGSKKDRVKFAKIILLAVMLYLLLWM